MLEDFGYSMSDPKRASKHLSENWGKWCGHLQRLDLDSDDHRGLSRKALTMRRAADEELASSEQETWFSTEALLALMQAFCFDRRELAIRKKVDVMGRMFLEQTVGPEIASGIRVLEPSPDFLGQCAAAPMQNNRCACFEAALNGWPQFRDMSSLTPQAVMWEGLKHLYGALDCRAVRAWVRHLIMRLSENVLGSLSSWADLNWYKSSDAILQARRKARRVDAHIKQWVMQSTSRSEDMPTPALAARSLIGVCRTSSVKWMHQEMAAYQASCLLTFREPPSSLSVAMDCARIGMPGVEFLVIAASDLEHRLHAVLAPQVRAVLSDHVVSGLCDIGLKS